MRQVIDGKAYDTSTADKLGEASSILARTDFRHWEEALYRTKRGAYFIAGGGGPMTRWAIPCDKGTSGSEGIKVLTETEARQWVEKYCNDRYEKIFGKVEEA
jgi:hypothetical protein